MKFVLEKLIDNLVASHYIFTFFKFRVDYFLDRELSDRGLRQRRLYRLQIFYMVRHWNSSVNRLYRLETILDLGNSLVEFPTSLFGLMKLYFPSVHIAVYL